jgi:hypothetical protein
MTPRDNRSLSPASATASARLASAIDRRQRIIHHQPAWHADQRIVRVHLHAGWRAGEQFAQQHTAMLGHEHVGQLQRAAAGAGQTEHMPVVDDLDFAERHQQVGDAGRIAVVAEKRADDGPARVCAAAGERVQSA